jgi:hypothetical protein
VLGLTPPGVLYFFADSWLADPLRPAVAYAAGVARLDAGTLHPEIHRTIDQGRTWQLWAPGFAVLAPDFHSAGGFPGQRVRPSGTPPTTAPSRR